MPLLWISLSFLAGIVLAAYVSLPAWAWALIALPFFLLSLFLRNPQRVARFSFLITYPLIPLLPIFLFLGSAYYQIRQPQIDAFHIAFYNDRNYELLITGFLAEPPDYRDNYTNLTLNVQAVDTGDGDLPVSGLLLVRVPANETYVYGERIRVRGELKTPPENEEFSYRDYLARQGIHAYMTKSEVTRLPGNDGGAIRKLVYALKTDLLANTYRLFQDPEASLFAGILFGVDTGLPKKLQDAFKNTGTAHIIAISGFNIAIISGFFFKAFKFFLRRERPAAGLAIAFVFLYAFLVGLDAAVLRAAIMGSIAMFAALIGRKQWTLGTLGFVALIMALINPLTLWDIGFQLSFFATLGLILYADPFANFTARIFRISDEGILRFISDNVLLTLAAQVLTIPLMLYYFHRISLIAFVVNPFILLVQPAVMILGGIAVFISLVAFPIGQLLAWVAWPFAGYTIRVVE